ncbi:MAG: hypothetical protein M3O06_12260 [Pseudomonadota bacterium]|nr:hypothetical protein [Pseudomonadota bacterium]
MGRRGSLQLALQLAVLGVVMFVFVTPASAIPAFARKYSLRCTSCHEAWPVLNDFGRTFRDNGYQLRLGKDDTVTAEPGYWPVAVHVTPAYKYSKTTNQATDTVPGVAGGVVPGDLAPRDIGSGSVADASMDLLMAGVLTKNISFLVVPTGFASDGNVHLESYWAYFTRIFKNSDWFNFRIGQHEIDLPASSHRTLTYVSNYLMYAYHPGVPAAIINADKRFTGNPNFLAYGSAQLSAYDMGANQRGFEFTGHSPQDTTRYSVSVFSAHDSLGSSNGLSSPSFAGHFQKFVRFDKGPVSEAEVGVWGVVANSPTEFVTLGGTPLPNTGHNLQSSSRYGAEANVWIGPTVAPLHLDLVYGHGVDKKGLVISSDRDGVWNGGFLEAIWVPPVEALHWAVFGRYDVIRNQKQPVIAAPSNYNDQDQISLGLTYTIAYSIRDEVAFRAEVASLKNKGVGFAGLDQRTDTLTLGVDFVY